MWEVLYNKICAECEMSEQDKTVLFNTLSHSTQEMIMDLMMIYILNEN